MTLLLLVACAGGTRDRFELESPAIGDTFAVRTWVPDDAGEGAPLVVVLDGDAWFETVVREQASLAAAGEAPAAVVAGVGYAGANARSRDLVPEAEDPDGGVAAFVAFLGDTVVPEVAARTGASGERDDHCLLGHSLGGFATLWALLDGAEAFGGYVAVSPSLWVDEGVAFDLLAAADPAIEARLFSGHGSLETPAAIAAPHALLVEELDGGALPAVEHAHAIWPGASHSRVVGPAWRDGGALCLGAP